MVVVVVALFPRMFGLRRQSQPVLGASLALGISLLDDGAGVRQVPARLSRDSLERNRRRVVPVVVTVHPLGVRPVQCNVLASFETRTG